MDVSLSVEIYSIVLLLVLILEYYSKFKNNLSRNSYIFLICAFSLLIISSINILTDFAIINSSSKHILKIINYSLVIFPPSFLFLYININFLSQQKYYKKYNLFVKSFCLIYWILQILIIIIYENGLKFLIFNSAIVSSSKYFLFFSIIPLFLAMFQWFYHIITRKILFTISYFLVILIPIIGVSFDILFSKAYFIVASYVISLLLLYIGKKNSVIYTDPLTGLYNRQILEESILFDRNLKHGEVVLVFIDIDKFKRINDTYGHLTGDKILIDIAMILKKSTRKSDYVLRIGGDEFLIIASIEAKENINTIKNKIKNNLREYNNNSEIRIGLSMGHDIYKGSKARFNLEKYLDKVDQKMYKEKSQHHKKQYF